MASTKKAEGPDLQKLGKLLEAYQVTHDQGSAILKEMKALLGGGPGVGAQMKHLTEVFSNLWYARYQTGYVWAHIRDKPQLKRLLQSLDAVEIEKRMLRYFGTTDAFLAVKRHPFGVFVSTINSYAAASEAPEFELGNAPVECHHTPRCATEQLHTIARRAEMRAE